MQGLPQNNLGHLLAKALHKWNNELISAFALKGFKDIKPSYGAIFVPLFSQDGESVANIIKQSRLSKQVISTYTNEIRKKGYIIPQTDLKDKRVTRLYLTEKGIRFNKAAVKVMRELEDAAALKIGKKELGVLVKMLSKYIN